MSSNDTILTMENITKTFGPVKALTDVNLSVDRGEIHAICGENGAGKSTLMKVLSGVWVHGSYGGKIIFEGQEAQFSKIKDSEEKGIVIIHQELALIPELSVTENIFLGSEVMKGRLIDWDAARLQAMDLLARVGLEVDVGVVDAESVELRLRAAAVAAPVGAEHRDGVGGHASSVRPRAPSATATGSSCGVVVGVRRGA